MGFRKSILLIGTILGTGLAAQAQAQTSPSAYTAGIRYDAMHRVTGTIAPDPDVAGPLHYMATRNTYDLAGRLTKVEKGELASWQSETPGQPETGPPLSWTGFTVLQVIDITYDALDRKTVETVSAAGVVQTVTQTSYDNLGRLDCTAVRMNPAVWTSLPTSACTLTTTGSNGPDRITHNVYDLAGQLLKVQRAYGTSLQQDYAVYTYSPTGKQTSVTDADGNLATMGYDGLDRQQTWVFPSPTTHGQVNAADFEQYGYDANGNRTSFKKRDGTTLTYQYDALNRLTLKTVPTSATGAAGYSVYQGYDNRGLLLYARFGSAAGSGITNVYDNVGQLTSSITNMDGTARTYGSQYDADGNRTLLTGDQGYAMHYDYDGLDRMSGVRETNASGAQIAWLAYDQLGRRSSLGQGYNTSTSVTSYAYDGASRLQTQTHDFNVSVTGTDQVLGFGYNPASQVVQRTRSNASWEYTEATPGTKAYTTNGLNQYSQAGTNTYLYDANGNLKSDGTRTYVYDAENRLVSVTGDISSTLSYDPMGRLWQYSGPQSGTLRFLYDGDQLTQEMNTSAVMQRSYVHGPGADEPLNWYEFAGGSVHHYLHADHQGSIVAVTDDAGNPYAIDKYDEWGVPAAANLGRFQYTGQVWLADLGLYYYKARMYSSRLGRFLQTDPIGYKDQINLYAYVGNDPVDGRDPTGMAEMNLFSDPGQRAIGNIIDFPGAFTIAGHAGNNEGITDLVHNRRYSPFQMERLAEKNGYKPGQLTFLAACLTGLVKVGGSSQTYAQDYAKVSRGPVLASPDEIIFHPEGHGVVTMRTDAGNGFYIYRDKLEPVYLGSQIRYDSKTGIVHIFSGERPGTRTRDNRIICVDKEKCGGKK